MTTTTTDTNKLWSEKLTWAFSSGELKTKHTVLQINVYTTTKIQIELSPFDIVFASKDAISTKSYCSHSASLCVVAQRKTPSGERFGKDDDIQTDRQTKNYRLPPIDAKCNCTKFEICTSYHVTTKVFKDEFGGDGQTDWWTDNVITRGLPTFSCGALGRSFHAHHYFILSLSVWWPRRFKKK